MRSSAPLPGLAKVTIGGLIATGLGFLGAAVERGPGPAFVEGAPTVGIFYLPPLLMGLAVLVVAGLVATRVRWMPAVAAAFAAILLLGSVTVASASVFYRLTHPGEFIGFAEDWLQVGGEAIAIVAGVAATVQLLRRRHGRVRGGESAPDEHVAGSRKIGTGSNAR